jgi:uncharacterized repeat protein (TIGR01451 family)
LALAVLGSAAVASAQGQGDDAQDREKTFLDRVDDLGKTIISPFLPGDKAKLKDQAATDQPSPSTSVSGSATSDPTANQGVPPGTGGRAGSILSGYAPGRPMTTQSPPAPPMPPAAPPPTMSADTLPPVPTADDGTSQTFQRAPVDRSMLSDTDVPEKPVRRTRSGTPAAVPTEPSPAVPLAPETEKPAATKAATEPSQPLHQRLSTFRKSPFDDDSGERPVSQPETPRARTVETPADRPQTPSKPAPAPAATEPAADEPEAKVPTPARRPHVAERTRPAPDPVMSTPPAPQESVSNAPITTEAPAAEKTPAAVERKSARVEKAPAKIEKSPTAGEEVADKPESGDVLVARKGPAINVETLGPRRISVGKESTYQVSITNSGEVAGEELTVFVSLPPWAEVLNVESTSGTAHANATGQAPGTVVWKLGHLEAKGHEQLALKIIPRQNRPFDLAVRWESRPLASQAMIEVQEPKLVLQLDGPREVLYGKKEVYRLKLTNVGNGNAENVSIMLMPVGGGENVPAAHKIGVLAAGAEKLLDVELTARQAGNLMIQVDARADAGVHAELAEKVLVRRANLQIDTEGPKVQFVGATATYTVRVRNTGTAQAQNVHMSIILPAGTEYVSGIEEGRLDASKRKVDWTIEAINPDAEQTSALKCTLGAAGIARVQVMAGGADDLTATSAVMTRVDAVANLALDVTDPQGPVAVGEEAIYEIRVRNRGTREAENVQVFVYFSRGIEPIGAEGAPNRLAPGQVLFQPIVSLGAGTEVVLKVHAKADVPGNHIFRAEAHCRPLGARLVREATNLYYADSSPAQQAPQGQPVPPQTPQVAREPGMDRSPTEAARAIPRPPMQGDPLPPPPPRK